MFAFVTCVMSPGTLAILCVTTDALSNDAGNTTSDTCIIYYKLKLQEILKSYFAILSPSDGYLQKVAWRQVVN